MAHELARTHAIYPEPTGTVRISNEGCYATDGLNDKEATPYPRGSRAPSEASRSAGIR